MKLAYYLPSLESPGGLERIIVFKANFFASHGFDVTIITSEQGNRPTHYNLSPKIKHIDLNVPFDYPYNQNTFLKLAKYPFRYRIFKKRFERTLLDIQPDITISTLRREINFITSIKDGSAKIGEFHITRYSYGLGNTKSSILKIFNKYWSNNFVMKLSKLKKVVLLTHEETEFWPELDNIKVIPNPIVTTSELVSDCSNKIVMAAGRYTEQKAFDKLIASWALVSKKHPDWQLNIYGDGALRDSLQKQINELVLQNNCTLRPTTKNIAEEYANSSIFVLSSIYEGFGMVITEAMSCGLPVISFACPCGPKDIISDGVNGFLIKPYDINVMAERICSLIENKKMRQEMGNNALKSSANYHMDSIAKKWIELFNDLTKEKHEMV